MLPPDNSSPVSAHSGEGFAREVYVRADSGRCRPECKAQLIECNYRIVNLPRQGAGPYSDHQHTQRANRYRQDPQNGHNASLLSAAVSNQALDAFKPCVAFQQEMEVEQVVMTESRPILLFQ